MTVYINAISGLTPFGNLEETWKGITDNKVCYGPITKFIPDRYTRSTIAGEVSFNSEDYSIITEIERDKMPEHMQWTLGLASELLEGTELSKDRTSVIVSSGISTYLESIRANESGIDNSYTFSPNLIANNINIKYGFTGPSLMSMTACSSGLYSIIMGCMLIETGQADHVIAGAVDQTIDANSYKQLCKLRALSTKYNNEPEIASRPWDTNRDGFVLSEGGALFLLSNERTHNTLAEITGYAMTNDAHAVVAPHPNGTEIERCMRIALNNKVPDLINAHATSTPMGDYLEIDAINRLGLSNSWITANKSQLGHLMVGAGAIETALSVLSLKHDIITPSLNIDNLKDGYEIKYTPKPIHHQVNSVLCNSFGFGGTNASLSLSKT
jgi:3-oxoacyl-[acyl-carrier-protein] synthase II